MFRRALRQGNPCFAPLTQASRRTGNHQRSRLRRSNDIHPNQAEQANPNNRRGGNQEGQTKQQTRQEDVIEVKEDHVVTKAFNEERNSCFPIKGTFFANTKVDGNRPQMLPLKDRPNVLLGRVGNGGRYPANGIIGATGIPFILADERNRVNGDG